jgi:asparagine synthetase B (glutamine-hydrolysing)
MCGIVGMLSRRGPVSAATLQKAAQSLHHRGPMDSGSGSHPIAA